MDFKIIKVKDIPMTKYAPLKTACKSLVAGDAIQIPCHSVNEHSSIYYAVKRLGLGLKINKVNGFVYITK